MSNIKIKHAFPGGNTSCGFFSYYEHILNSEKAKKIFIIKGGPGVGKSTFFKKIASNMVKNGYDVEFMHCSSDDNSLDALVIPNLKIALIDGTPPHAVEPRYPGAVEEIINFGDYWNEPEIRLNKDMIIKTSKEKGRYFAGAFRYLKAASLIIDDSAQIYNDAMYKTMINQVTHRLLDELFSDIKIGNRLGKDRRLFASAITPDGLKHYLESILTTKKVIAIKGAKGTSSENILEKVRALAIEAGYNVECYYCALYPNKLEHLIIPDISTSLTTVNEYHKAEIEYSDTIDLNEFLDMEQIESYKSMLEYNKVEATILLNRAITMLEKARASHSALERYYSSSINFEKIDEFYNILMARILNY